MNNLYHPLYVFDQYLNIESVYLIDHVLFKIAEIFETKTTPIELLLVGLSVSAFFICFYMSLRKIGKSSNFSILLTSYIVFSIYFLRGTAFTFLEIYPLSIIILLSLFCLENSFIKKFIFYFLNLFFYLTSGPLSLIFYFVPSFIGIKALRLKLMDLVSLAICIWISYSFGETFHTFFDYPRISRVTDVSTLHRLGEVVLGSERLPLTIVADHFTLLRKKILAVSAISLLPFIITILMNRGTFNLSVRFKLLFSILSIMLVSSLFPQEKYINSPESLFYSVIPGVIWRFNPVILPSMFLISFSLICSRKIEASLKLSILMLVCLLLQASLSIVDKSDYFYSKLKSDMPKVRVEHSPSSNVLKTYGLSSNYRVKSDSELYEVSNLEKNCKVEVSRNSDKASYVLDGNINTKWSTNASQNQDDFLLISCSSEILFDRISLLVGSNDTDFPRGFEVQSGLDSSRMSVVKSFPIWMGAISETKNGYPYFIGQDQVIVDFEEQQHSRIIKIKLLKTDKIFSWTIAELKIYRSKVSS